MICKSKLLVATLALVALASAANAATLTVVADQATYNIGDTITLTVTGDSQGAQALSIFGRLNLDNPSVANVAAGTSTQTTLIAIAPAVIWTAGPLACNSFSCEIMNQLSAFGLAPAPAVNLMIGTATFQASALGTTNVNWETDPGTGFQLDFFGLTNAQGTSFEVVPEPTTAALLGLGLMGLTAAGRRRA